MMSYKKIDMQAAMIQGIEDMSYARATWRETPRSNETLGAYLTKRNHYVSYYEGAVYALEMLETWALEAKKERKKLAKKAKDDAQVYRNLFGEEDTRPSEMPEDL